MMPFPFHLALLLLLPGFTFAAFLQLHLEEGSFLNFATVPSHFYSEIERIAGKPSGSHSISLTVTSPPKYGTIYLRDKPTSVFTLQDAKSGAVRYQHDGSETQSDTVTLGLHSSRVRQSFQLHLRITPVNDPPLLYFPLGREFQIIRQSALDFSSKYIVIMDADNPVGQTTVEILSVQGGGFFDLKTEPGKEVTVFSQADLEASNVRFVNADSPVSQVLLRASDGKTTSAVEKVFFPSYVLYITQQANTGIEVLHGATAPITSQNLSFSTNAILQDVDVVFELQRLPDFGFIEVMVGNGTWWITEAFNQSQAKQGLPLKDSFGFAVKALSHRSIEHYEFLITFVVVSIKVYQQVPFVLNGTESSSLTRENIFAWTFPHSSSPSEIVYHITRPTRRGFLYRTRGPGRRDRRIGMGFNFTQAEVNAGRIYYKLHHGHYSILNDDLAFTVVTPLVKGQENRLTITYIPEDQYIQLTNMTIYVKEGQETVVGRDYLWIETKDHTDFHFTVLEGTRNGQLLLKTSSQTIRLSEGSNFTSFDIYSSKFSYSHDGRETTRDTFLLKATPAIHSKGVFEVTVRVSLKIVLVNDNPPTWNTTFYRHPTVPIVFHGERLLSWRDLYFVDLDKDFNDADLKFEFQHFGMNSNFYSAKFPEIPLNVFTNRDISSEDILLRHFGQDRTFEVPFSVTDGKYVTNSSLRVNASDPFIQLNVETVKVKARDCAMLQPETLYVVTNVNARLVRQRYSVSKQPMYGRLLRVVSLDRDCGNGERIEAFTQRDVDDGIIFYKHEEWLESAADNFTVTATVGNALTAVATVNVVVESSRRHFNVTMSADVKVVTGSVALVTTDNVLVSSPHSTADDIVFTLVHQPKYGVLVTDQTSSAIDSFTQNDVLQRRVSYMHTGAGLETQPDILELRVALRHNSSIARLLYLQVHIVAESISLQAVSNISVFRGEASAVDQQILRVTGAYEQHDVEFVIAANPQHGWIELRSSPTAPPVFDKTFSLTDMLFSRIFYVHDGSNHFKDAFTLQCKNIRTGRHSEVVHVNVAVMHKNVEGPKVVVNRPLEAYKLKTTLSDRNLRATDPDSSPAELVYFVSQPQHGRIALESNHSRRITNFTQSQLQLGVVLFVTNETTFETSGFSFVVFDGKHQTDAQWFVIKNLLADRMKATITVAPSNSVFLTAEQFSLTPSATVTILPPQHGHLVVNGRANVTTFTAMDLQEGKVAYRAKSRLARWRQIEQLQYRASGVLKTLPIHISYSFMSPKDTRKIIPMQTFHCLNDSAPIRLDTVDPSTALNTINNADLRISILPSRGHLLLEQREVMVGQVVTVDQIANGQFIYFWRTPDFRSDSFALSVGPNSAVESTDAANMRVVLLIDVERSPSKNGKVQMMSVAPVITIVSGYSRLLTSDDILFVRPGLSPSEIIIAVKKFPPQTTVNVQNNETASSFSQEQITSGKVSLQTTQLQGRSPFVFQVSTKLDNPIQYSVDVVVDPVFVTIDAVRPVRYRQLDALHPIAVNASHIDVRTNGRDNDVRFTITTDANNGALFMQQRGSTIASFTLEDINEGRLFFSLQNMANGNDQVEVVVQHALNKTIRLSFNWITFEVLPQIIQDDAISFPGTSFYLETKHLNATALASALSVIDNSDIVPVFLVTEPPKYGTLTKRRRTPSRRYARYIRGVGVVQGPVSLNVSTAVEAAASAINDGFVEVNFFTTKDLETKSIRYTSTLALNRDIQVKDNFVFVLKADGFVPPAHGTFNIYIDSKLNMRTAHESKAITTVSEAADAGTPTATARPPTTPDMKPDHLVAIASGIAICILSGLLIVFCKIYVSFKRNRKTRHAEPYHRPATVQAGNKPDLIASGNHFEATIDPSRTRDAQSKTSSSVLSSPTPIHVMDLIDATRQRRTNPAEENYQLRTFEQRRPLQRPTMESPGTASLGLVNRRSLGPHNSTPTASSESPRDHPVRHPALTTYDYSSSASEHSKDDAQPPTVHFAVERQRPPQLARMKLKDNQYWV